MPNRILKDSICTSPNIDQLGRDAEVFFYRLIVQCDDFGRMDARLPILRAKCYPLQLDRASESDIAEWLNELVRAGLVIVYTVNGQNYLQMCTWDKHQQVRAKRSKYPHPISIDINCNQAQSNAPVIQSNPIQSEPGVGGGVSDEGWKAVCMAYESNIGSFTDMSSEMVRAAYDEFGSILIVDAIKVAVSGNRRKWSYVEGILKRWRADGKTVPTSNGKPKKAMYATDPFTGKTIEVLV